MSSTTIANRDLRQLGAKLVAVCLVSVGLAACGGGGGGVSSTPTPPTAPPSPPPPPPSSTSTTSKSIFPDPTPQTYASVGIAKAADGGVSTADSDQMHIRYSAAGYYEIQMPGDQWERLTIAKGFIPADPAIVNSFQPASAPQNGAYLNTSMAKLEGYQYSEMGTWADGLNGGWIAFGSATSPSQMPITGAATYNGLVSGSSTVMQEDGWADSGKSPVPFAGTVQLTFDFGRGTLNGGMNLALDFYTGKVALGSFAFTQTVYSTGSAAYSGKFVTNAVGDNFFLGQFTGPTGQETIGAWALPFDYLGKGEQGYGAWIAKR